MHSTQASFPEPSWVHAVRYQHLNYVLEIINYNSDKITGLLPNTCMIPMVPATDYSWNLISANEKIMEEIKSYKHNTTIIDMSIGWRQSFCKERGS